MAERLSRGRPEPMRASVKPDIGMPARKALPLEEFKPRREKPKRRKPGRGKRIAVGAGSAVVLIAGAFGAREALSSRPEPQPSISGPVIPGQTTKPDQTIRPSNKPTKTPENPYKDLKPTGEILDITNKPLELGIVPVLNQDVMIDAKVGYTRALVSGIVVGAEQKKLRGYGSDGDIFSIVKVYFGKHQGKDVLGEFIWGNNWRVGVYNLRRELFFSSEPYSDSNVKNTYAPTAEELSKILNKDLEGEDRHQFIFEIVVDFDPDKYPVEEGGDTLISYNATLLDLIRGREVNPNQNKFGWIGAAFIPSPLQNN